MRIKHKYLYEDLSVVTEIKKTIQCAEISPKY